MKVYVCVHVELYMETIYYFYENCIVALITYYIVICFMLPIYLDILVLIFWNGYQEGQVEKVLCIKFHYKVTVSP